VFLSLGLAILISSPVAMAETLVVANKSDDTVDLIDLGTGVSAATLPTGHAPHEIAVSPEGDLAVITNYGDREVPGHTLTVIDIRQAQSLRTIDLGDHTRPHGLGFIGQDKVVVTTEGSAHLLVVDIDKGQILKAVETGQEISHMVAATPDGTRAFVANIGSGTVTAIDLEAGAKIADIVTGAGAEAIALTPNGREVWVGNRGADTLSILDPSTLEILETIPCPGFPIRIAFTPDGSRALISAARSGEVVVIDTGRRQELTRTRLDLSNAPDASRRLFGDRFGESPVPVGLVISPDGETAWVAATQADAVVVVEPRQLVVRDLLAAGHEPDGMAFSPATVQTPPTADR
jgi:YVTN family beta-propeller protein